LPIDAFGKHHDPARTTRAFAVEPDTEELSGC
jgi:hypothetical protein